MAKKIVQKAVRIARGTALAPGAAVTVALVLGAATMARLAFLGGAIPASLRDARSVGIATSRNASL